jgi:hypothetical protein
MTTNPLKALAFCAAATVALVVSGSSGAMAIIAGGPNASDQAGIVKTAPSFIPVARRGHYQGNRWNGHHGYRGDRGWHGYRGHHGWRGGYRGWGYVAPYWGYYPGYYYGSPVFGDPYFYYGGPPYDNYSPPVQNPSVASGRCSYWHRQCVKNWGNANSNYYGCMRYEKCAP